MAKKQPVTVSEVLVVVAGVFAVIGFFVTSQGESSFLPGVIVGFIIFWVVIAIEMMVAAFVLRITDTLEVLTIALGEGH